MQYARPFLVAGLAAWMVIMAGGCAGSRQAANEAAPFPPTYERQVYPFEVRDADGTPIDHPFLGGFNLPRPQFVDIDGDGDQDLFVQELTDYLMYFENVGTATSPEYRWSSGKFEDLDIGEWYRFFDLDQDGDYDLLGEMPYSYIRLFMNEGSPTAPSFSAALDSLRGADGLPLFADRQNIPALLDLDCDGHLDMFIGRVDGTVRRYESVGTDEAGLPRLTLVDERFEDIEILGQFVSLHGANALTFHDVDQDGDPDLFWGDFFEPGVLLIRNTGTCERPSLRTEPVPFPVGDEVATSGYNAVQFANIDGDNDADFFIGVLGGAFNTNTSSIANFYFLEASPDGYTRRSQQFLEQIDAGADAIPTFADLDGDGDQDLLLSNKAAQEELGTSYILHYENQSTAEGGTSFQLLGRLPLTGNYAMRPALADLDADGDLDMMMGTWNEGVHYYENRGSAERYDFAPVPEWNVTLTRGSYSTPSLADIDADGDYDLFIGESSGELNFYRNEGTPEDPAFVLVTDNFDDIDVGRRSVPTFVDLDGDGDQDLVVGCEAGAAPLFLNVGTPSEPVFESAGTLSAPLPYYSAVAFLDTNGDGALDLVTGGLGGGLQYFQQAW